MNNEINLKTLLVKKPLKLDCGKTINNFPIAYETYGTLNEKKDNAILVFHALTGDQFVAGLNPVTNKDGWWSYAVGPNKSIDTNKEVKLDDESQDNSSLSIEDAKKKLIVLKEYLDLGIITQNEFDEKAKPLKKILLDD